MTVYILRLLRIPENKWGVLFDIHSITQWTGKDHLNRSTNPTNHTSHTDTEDLVMTSHSPK